MDSHNGFSFDPHSSTKQVVVFSPACRKDTPPLRTVFARSKDLSVVKILSIQNHLRQVDMILKVEIRMLKCKDMIEEKISTSFGCTFAVIYIQWNQRCAWKLGSKTPALRLEHPGAPRRKNNALRLWQEIPEDDMTGILPSTHPTLKFESSQSHSPCRFLISVTDVFIVRKDYKSNISRTLHLVNICKQLWVIR